MDRHRLYRYSGTGQGLVTIDTATKRLEALYSDHDDSAHILNKDLGQALVNRAPHHNQIRLRDRIAAAPVLFSTLTPAGQAGVTG